MAEVTKELVEAAIKGFCEPHLKRDLVAAGAIKGIAVEGDQVKVKVVLGFPAKGVQQAIADAVQARVMTVPGVAMAAVDVSWEIKAHSVQKSLKPIDNVKNIIAVASGKGGVGKSTTAVNLALALAAEGARVGILDADIYGPSQPRMLGITGQPECKDGKTLEPMNAYDLQAMSIGFLIDEETPMIWRGPMVTQALEQLPERHQLGGARLSGHRPAAGHRRHPVDPGPEGPGLRGGDRDHAPGYRPARRPQGAEDVPEGGGAGARYRREHERPHLLQVRRQEHVFGSGGGAAHVRAIRIDLLGSLPLEIGIREETDNGKPTVVARPECAPARSIGRSPARPPPGCRSRPRTMRPNSRGLSFRTTDV